MVKIQNNTKDGILRLIESEYDEPILVIDVIEERRRMTNIHPEMGVRTMSIDIRKAEIKGSLKTMMLLNLEPGTQMMGRIVHRYTTTPPDGDDPEAYLYSEDGQFKKTKNGDYIWRFSYYTENPHEPDEKCPE